jgi:CHAT domain-containing protein/Flp pilus assembly protein TadD
MLAIEREMYGNVHADVAGSLELLAEMQEESKAWDAARQARQKVLHVVAKLFGEGHYRVVDARLALAHVDRLARLTNEQRQQLAEADELEGRVLQLFGQGKHRSAIPLARQVMVTRKQLLGQEHPEYATSINNLAFAYCSAGEYAKAKPLYVQTLEIKRRILGEEHPSYATSLNNLATLYVSLGHYTKAEPLLAQALEIDKRVRGEKRPDNVQSVNNLACLYYSMGDYPKAESLYVEAMEIHQQVLGEEHPEYATSLENLAVMYHTMGNSAKAEPLYMQALEIRRRVLGEEHPDYATSLSNLAHMYYSMGDYAKAEPLQVRARDIWKRVVGEKHPHYATILNNLAYLYERMGAYAKAEPLYVQTMEIRQQILDEEHPDYAMSLNNLAALYHSTGDHAKAEPLYLQALEIRKRTLGQEHPSYAASLNNLACLYRSMGDYAKAEPLCAQAGEIWKRVLGEEHPEHATSLNNLGFLYSSKGEYAKAEPLLRRALAARLNVAWNTLPWLPEARAMSFLQEYRPRVDLPLSALRRLPGVDHQEVYSAVWATRALITRTISQRRHGLLGSPEAQRLYEELRRAGQQLAQVTLAVTEPGGRERRQKRLAELNQKKEALEQDLSKLSMEYRRSTEVVEAGAADLAKALPEDTAVLDIIRVIVSSPAAEGKAQLEGKAHYEAFVIRPQEKGDDYRVAWLHLGPAEPIEDAIAQWCKAIRGRRDRGFGAARPLPRQVSSKAGRQAAPGQPLRRLIWEKLEPHLNGIQTVVVIPDAELTRLPWAALPGRKPDTYLLEDYAIAIAGNGQQLYARLTDPDISSDGLLLVGGVSYDESPTAPSSKQTVLTSADRIEPSRTRGPAMQGRPSWVFLAGSEQEVAGVRDLWPSSETVVLRGTSASETALRQFMPQSRYVHLATHGFFADEKFRSMFGHDMAGEQVFGGGMKLVSARRAGVTVRNPLILSGVVLAGANLPPKTDEHGLPTGEDGILTAEEVVNLDLRNTELVVLSACDTGLGKVAGGEGVFGLQRAFGLAGVRTTIASLWKVDDDATQALMVEFFKNLWGKKLGKLESLRQAQLTMLRQYDPKIRRFRGPGAVRPVGPARAEKARRMERKPRESLPPLYWAGFVLSGDWR